MAKKNPLRKIQLKKPLIENFTFDKLNNARLSFAKASISDNNSKKTHLAEIIYVENLSTDSLHGIIYKNPKTEEYDYYFLGDFEFIP